MDYKNSAESLILVYKIINVDSGLKCNANLSQFEDKKQFSLFLFGFWFV